MENKRIKYCALTTAFGSMKSFVIPSMRKLRENGYEVTLACKMDGETAQSLLPEFHTKRLDIERGYRLLKTVRNLFVLFFYFKKEKFDMIEYGSENVSFCAAIAGYFAGVPVRIYNHWGERYVGLKGFSRVVCKLIERTTAFFSTDIRQVSARNMELCVTDRIYKKGKVKVLGRGGTVGVDLKIFDKAGKALNRGEIRKRYGIGPGSAVIGYVGNIRREKGLNELITSFKKVLAAYPDSFLLLVGREYTADPVEKDVYEWAKGEPRVIFTGLVEDVYRYMSAMDMLVHPSYREGFSMVLQEASAMALPIITTNIPGPAEIVTDGVTGLLVGKADKDMLYKAICRLLDDRKLADSLADAAYRQAVEFFDREIMIQRIVDDRNFLYMRSKKG